MNSFDRAQRDYENPPEALEYPVCEFCGEDMEENFCAGVSMEWSCHTRFCPSKFDGMAKEMAEHILELVETIEALDKRVKFLKSKIDMMSNGKK
jgi:hypothetical protein